MFKIETLIALIFILVLLGIFSAPFISISRTITTQRALNAECGTNYNLIDVALAGDNLARLCRIKNQTITIK